ncbi:MAG: hypothetical protein ABW133_07410 [Polyangiaceae bacterium]
MSSLSSKMLLVSVATSALLAMAVGCGGDDSDTTGTAGRGGSGGSSSGGSGGEGGSTGGSGGSTGGSGGSTGGSGGSTPDGGDIVCGGTVCPPIAGPGGMAIPACCTMQNTCGIGVGTACFPTSFDAGGGGFDAGGGGVIDPNCGSATLAGMTLAGCCMTDNNCGFNTQFGCVAYSSISWLPGVGLPEGGMMTCTYVPPPVR